jgi:hypothetical protein
MLHLGVCRRRQGVYCFLNPSIMRNQKFDSTPYVFVHPDQFVEMVPLQAKRCATVTYQHCYRPDLHRVASSCHAVQQEQATRSMQLAPCIRTTHHAPASCIPRYQHADLHRVVLAPDERAVISKDGAPLQLPRDAAVSGGAVSNGVFHFRSMQLEIYGPVKKTEQYSELGPYIFFNVPVGHVAFGYDTAEGLKIWERGSHCLSIDKGQRFGGFFAINVDPIEIHNFHILSKHSISSHLNFFITYRINDARAAIEGFGGSHENVHRFVENSAKDVMLNLCQQRPPLGFCDGDFDGVSAARDAKRRSVTDAEADAAAAAGKDPTQRTNMDEMEHMMQEVRRRCAW